MTFDQSDWDIRCEWGLPGVRSLAPGSDIAVIVDVLSFSTAVDIAVAGGASILPYRWKDASAEAYAASKNALLAGKRTCDAGYSLSPASLESILPGEALVLPSPNGSTLSMESGALTRTCCACLRNARAVAARIQLTAMRIAVIPAGEQWDDGSLRPCVEDLIGAGAVIAELRGTLSPEAELALAVFEKFRLSLHDAIRSCGSGRELAERGFPRDIELAADLNVSDCVPLFREDRYQR
jgi:2-phosphosulfolactate phosphatase